MTSGYSWAPRRSVTAAACPLRERCPTARLPHHKTRQGRRRAAIVDRSEGSGVPAWQRRGNLRRRAVPCPLRQTSARRFTGFPLPGCLRLQCPEEGMAGGPTPEGDSRQMGLAGGAHARSLLSNGRWNSDGPST
jgi:hypothetical protein